MGVKTGSRFVEQHQFGVVDEGDGKAEALLFAAAQLARLPPGLVVQPEPCQHRHRRALVQLHPIHARVELHEFPQREVIEEGRHLQAHAHTLPQPRHVGQAQRLELPGLRLPQPGDGVE